MPEAAYGRSNRWLTAALIESDVFGATNGEIMESLAALNIESRPVWEPMHMRPVFADAPATLNGVSEHLFAQGLCLPSSSSLGLDQQDRVIEAVRSRARA